jgi:hypothetical protein
MNTYKKRSILARTLFLVLPITLVGTTSVYAASLPPAFSFQLASAVSDLNDLPNSHWSYQAVKYLVEELDVMPPSTATQFKGNAIMTRYELAQVFYNIIRKLEVANGKSLAKLSDAPAEDMKDLDDKHQMVVNSVVNDYGIMQPMPGHQFLGNEAITRYELAHELHNYFLLVESQSGPPALAQRDRSSQFTDISSEHWATKAVRAIVDKYQIMEGYPDETFKGGKRLTRYEAAATLRDFIGYVNAYLMPIVPSPTPMPTAVPTAKPSPVATPIPSPTPKPKEPLRTFDLRLGGDFRIANVSSGASSNLLNDSVYGANSELTIWFPKLGDARFGVDLHADFLNWHKPDDFTNLNNLNRTTAGGSIFWRALGADSAEDFSMVLGLGYDLTNLNGNFKANGNSYQVMSHGPTGTLGFEYPVTSWLSLVANDRFTWFLGNQNYVDRYVWRNDAFVGINIPAYTFATFELGYRDTRYIQADKPSVVLGDIGPEANLRLRF